MEEMRYVYAEMKSLGADCRMALQDGVLDYKFSWVNKLREPISITFIVVGDMGNLRTALIAAPWINRLRPDMCFLIGIAGSMCEEVRVGDVVVATSAKTYYPDKVREIDAARHVFGSAMDSPPSGPPFHLDDRKRYMRTSFFRYRRDYVRLAPSSLKADDYITHIQNHGPPPLLALTDQEVPGLPGDVENLNPRISYGTIFSGEMVVDSQEYIDFIVSKDASDSQDLYTQMGVSFGHRFIAPLLAVDMESYGFLKLAWNMVPTIDGQRGADAMHTFSVRGISDKASQKEVLDLATNDGARRVAVVNAVRVAVDMIAMLDTSAIH
jgi:nucleoside phosphorylase